MKYAFTLISLFVTGCVLVTAGTERTVDLSTFATPITSVKSNTAQSTAFSSAFMMNDAAAYALFANGDRYLAITNVPLPPNGTGVLHLELCAPVFDANTKFLVNTPEGKKAIKVRPIYSYKGRVEGEPDSRVSLHYSSGDLTGFVLHADGSRTLIGRAPEYRSTQGSSPFVIESEGANARPLSLSSFTCGSDLLPADERAAVTSMVMPSSLKDGESIQSLPLKEFRLALVLREDVDSILRLQGMNEEQVAQHFAKIVAAMSQVYEEELGAHMYIGYLLSFSTDAPSGYIYDGRDPGKLLNEFSLDWSAGYDNVERTVAHMYCLKRPVGGLYVGGIAYGGQAGSRLCVTDHQGAYGVSTMDLNLSQPIPGDAGIRNAFVWDVFVASHEIGHNVGAPHTHNCYWSPPIDTCQLQGDGTDACYSDPSLRRVRPGTIMSYCHLVNGSTTPLTFGTRVAERMRSWIDASCMKVVTTPMVGITEPRGHDEWSGGQKVAIKWVSAMVSTVDLAYSLDGSTGWKSIATGLNAADGSYNWTVPGLSATAIWIRISSTTDNNVENISLASYTIKVPLSMLAPSGGERMGKGTSYQIRWAKESTVSSVDIFFSADGGITWEPIASGQKTLTYAWTVNDVVTENALIKVVSSTNSSISAVSGAFAIGSPSYGLLLPKEGTQLCNNFDNQFKWSGDFIDRIKIQYSTDGGGTWRNALQPLTVSLSQWEIFSRNSSLINIDAGTKVSLRVIDATTESVLDTRNELTIASCTEVTGVNEGPTSTSTLAIERTSPNPANTSTTLTIQHTQELNASVVAVDASGSQTVLVPSILLQGAGPTLLSVPLDVLPQGAYRIVVRGQGAQADVPVRIVR